MIPRDQRPTNGEDAEFIRYCNNINMGLEGDSFILRVDSGKDFRFYAMHPAHVKRLQIALTWHIEQYETKFGTIDTTWLPGIASPIQPHDLRGKRSEKEAPDASKNEKNKKEDERK